MIQEWCPVSALPVSARLVTPVGHDAPVSTDHVYERPLAWREVQVDKPEAHASDGVFAAWSCRATTQGGASYHLLTTHAQPGQDVVDRAFVGQLRALQARAITGLEAVEIFGGRLMLLFRERPAWPGRLPALDARLVAELYDALDEGHHNGLVHGAIDERSLCFPAGVAALRGWGLATVYAAWRASHGVPIGRMTADPRYASPDEWLGHPPSPESDRIALGLLVCAAWKRQANLPLATCTIGLAGLAAGQTRLGIQLQAMAQRDPHLADLLGRRIEAPPAPVVAVAPVAPTRAPPPPQMNVVAPNPQDVVDALVTPVVMDRLARAMDAMASRRHASQRAPASEPGAPRELGVRTYVGVFAAAFLGAALGLGVVGGGYSAWQGAAFPVVGMSGGGAPPAGTSAPVADPQRNKGQQGAPGFGPPANGSGTTGQGGRGQGGSGAVTAVVPAAPPAAEETAGGAPGGAEFGTVAELAAGPTTCMLKMPPGGYARRASLDFRLDPALNPGKRDKLCQVAAACKGSTVTVKLERHPAWTEGAERLGEIPSALSVHGLTASLLPATEASRALAPDKQRAYLVVGCE